MGFLRSPPHIARKSLKKMSLEVYVGLDASYAIWQTIARHLGRQNVGIIRAVCRMTRKAVDDAVTSITVPCDTDALQLPERERFPACQHYAFIDASEHLPQYVRRYCSRQLKQLSVVICGEVCWREPRVQEWLQSNVNELSWVGLVLRLCEEHQDRDLSAYLQQILAVDAGVQLSLLGLWCGVSSFLPCLCICGAPWCLSRMKV